MDDKRIQQLIEEAIKKVIMEEEGIQSQMASSAPTQPAKTQIQSTQPPVKAEQPVKATVVNFDKDTEHPFSVKFTERGFVIDNTRLSFETIENALSKGYDIVLNQGQELHLNQVRMQKILKYKDLYQQ